MVVTDVVKSKLKVLILERNAERARKGLKPLTTRRIAELTGIATSTLTGLTANRSKGVEFATLQAICRFFNCTPGDILEYQPEQEDFSDQREEVVNLNLGKYQGPYGQTVAKAVTGEIQRNRLRNPWLEE